jgi:hypothetical protein
MLAGALLAAGIPLHNTGIECKCASGNRMLAVDPVLLSTIEKPYFFGCPLFLPRIGTNAKEAPSSVGSQMYRKLTKIWIVSCESSMSPKLQDSINRIQIIFNLTQYH